MAGIDYNELKESFVNSSAAILQRSESCILILESSVDKNAIDELFRGIHTIKGNSGIFELKNIPRLSHSFENVLNLLRTSRLMPTPDLIDLMLLGIDRLREMIKDLKASESVDADDLIEKFNAYLSPAKDKEKASKDSKTVSEMQISNEETKWMKHIKVSDKIIEFAKSKKKYLSIVIFSLEVQQFRTVSGLLEKIQMIAKKARVLRKGLITKKLTPLENKINLHLPYFLILLSDSKVEEFLEEIGIQPEFVRTVFVPDNAESVHINPDRQNTEQTQTAKQVHPIKEISVKDTSINVNLDLLNHLINLTGEIVLARNILSLKILQSGNSELQSISKRFENLLSELESGILKTRLQSMNVFFQKIPRLVRDISKATGKQIDVHIEGGDVELDKSLIDEVSDPVTHLIRNAIDHGIENSEERQKKGKNSVGNLRVSARLRGGNVELIIGDDGRGLDIVKIRERIIQKNLAPPELVHRIPKEEIIEYLFMPGFSTAGSVTELSGRGVGLDVVRSNVKRIGGTVSIEFEENSGTSFILSIPQTLSIINCLVFKSGNRKFAIPQQYLCELIKINPINITKIENKSLYYLRNQMLPLVNLKNVFHIENDELKQSVEKFIIALKSEKYYFGINVDEILDTEEIVVKPLGEYFEELPFFSGVTVLGDGDIALILDVSGLARLSGLQNSQNLIESSALKEISKAEEIYLLFSVGAVKVTVSIASNPYIIKISAKEIIHFLGLDTFIHNKESVPILWLNDMLRSDFDIKSCESLSIILFNFQNSLIGVAATKIEGVTNELENIQSDRITGKGILGTAYKDNASILLLDISCLLEEFYRHKLKNIKLNLNDTDILPGA
ncbi:MAG TPA: chemotaxis protein CheA [Leptospiraceae bacterium]|nr:chemotaxis protein CheA [Leptospiraceae bacterium]